jgi:hypothetical protein
VSGLWLAVSVILIEGIGALGGSAHALLTPRKIKSEISREGPTQVLRRLFEDDSAWETVGRGIGSGSGQWLQVAAQLRSVSDAGASEGLTEAVQEALVHAPNAVLALACTVPATRCFRVEDVCGGYGPGQIEDERPLATILALVKKRKHVVKGVQEGNLAAKRQICLDQLDALERSLRR